MPQEANDLELNFNPPANSTSLSPENSDPTLPLEDEKGISSFSSNQRERKSSFSEGSENNLGNLNVSVTLSTEKDRQTYINETNPDHQKNNSGHDIILSPEKSFNTRGISRLTNHQTKNNPGGSGVNPNHHGHHGHSSSGGQAGHAGHSGQSSDAKRKFSQTHGPPGQAGLSGGGGGARKGVAGAGEHRGGQVSKRAAGGGFVKAVLPKVKILPIDQLLLHEGMYV